MDMRDFLGALEESNGNIFEGKEGTAVPKEFQEGLEKAGIKKSDIEWMYKPDDYDLVVVEHKSGDDKWSVVFFTEAEMDDEDDEDLFGLKKESLKLLDEAEVGLKPLDIAQGNYSDTVKLCVEIAQNKSMKNNMTASLVKSAKAKAKK